MRRDLNAKRTGAGKGAPTRKTWDAPRLTAIDMPRAEAGAGINADGPYPPS